MSRSTSLFAGLLGSFAVSCVVLVLVPQAQLGGLQPNFTEEDGKFSDLYPIQNAAVEKGRAVYAAEGCIQCHSQQVRDSHNGADIERGWGVRRTVARDYLYEQPPFLGSVRNGPDLANVGAPSWRNEFKGDTEAPAKRNAAWHYLHLYSPSLALAQIGKAGGNPTEGNQPPYRYLFEERKISGQPAADALKLSGEAAPKEGYEIVPTPKAKALVAYLLTLDRSHDLKEASAAPAPAAPSAPAAAAAPAAPAPAAK
jgi:cytochrome c oxidase cbb3-type subunit 2